MSRWEDQVIGDIRKLGIKESSKKILDRNVEKIIWEAKYSKKL